MPSFQIRPLGYAMGGIVTGIDLRKPLDDDTVDALRKEWLDRTLLYFPDQDLSAPELARFARYFGQYEKLPLRNHHVDDHDVEILTNQTINGVVWDGYKNGQDWHTDRSYTTCPTAAIVLSAKTIPEVGGDTLFANMYMAYDRLSPAMRRIVDDLYAIHDRELPLVFKGGLVPREVQAKMQKASAKFAAGETAILQPIARVHPETGRRSLYLGKRVREIAGMTEEESKAIIDFLNRHAVQYEFTYRHRWKANDLLFWDNRCTMHNALLDYDLANDPRTLYKCALTIEGKSETGRPYSREEFEPVAA
ncbi:MAG: TauD/TfdA family dioxygenase [Alphaproteobacteria bacterium]|nr:TauD/TfdA family dioxygenase [Alphaproteobacteria bacterium]